MTYHLLGNHALTGVFNGFSDIDERHAPTCVHVCGALDAPPLLPRGGVVGIPWETDHDLIDGFHVVGRECWESAA
jgi:hypothetical protein